MAEEETKELKGGKSAAELKESFGRRDEQERPNEQEFIEIDLFKAKVQSDMDKLKSMVEEAQNTMRQLEQSAENIKSIARNNSINIDGLTNALSSSNGGKGIIVNHGAGGELEIINGGLDGYNQPFDLDNVAASAKTFSVKDNGALSGGLWIYGVKKTAIADGAGMTWDATDEEWDATAISANSWVILTIETLTATATISVETTLSDGDSDTEIWPLWYIPYDGTGAKIDVANIIDLRNAIHVQGLS